MQLKYMIFSCGWGLTALLGCTGLSPTATQPVAVAGGASCLDTIQCYSSCADESCYAACDARAAQGVPPASRAVVQCVADSGCADDDCSLKACIGTLETCTGGPVAAAGSQADPAAAPAAPPPDPAAAGLVGSFAKSSSDFYMAGGVHTGSVVKQYTFGSDGTYSFRAEAWGGGFNNTYLIVHERGSYAVAGTTLTITPRAADGLIKDRDGNDTSTFTVPLEPVTYRWTFYYFAGIQETHLVLTPASATKRDGAFASNDLFPASYLYSASYRPEWRFP